MLVKLCEVYFSNYHSLNLMFQETQTKKVVLKYAVYYVQW